MDGGAPSFRTEGLAKLYRYWDGLRGSRRMPSRADIDPTAFKGVLGDMVMADVVREGDRARFRFRLYGAGLAELLGYDLTGKWLEEHPRPELRDAIEASWQQAAACSAPVLGIRSGVFDGRRRHYEYLALPLSSDGVTVDKILASQQALPEGMSVP